MLGGAAARGSLPVERALLPFVHEAHHQDGEENHHRPEAHRPDVLERHGLTRLVVRKIDAKAPDYIVIRGALSGRRPYLDDWIANGIPGYADRLVYAKGVNLVDPDAATLIGAGCKVCDRADCAQRAFPPLGRTLQIDENQRGFAPYASGM